MPDINGAYHGDEANVLPDNTAAFLHFSDQFAQNEQNRRQQLASQQKAEQERYGRVQKGIHDGIYNPALLKNDATNPMMRQAMDAVSANAMQTLNTQGEAAAQDVISKGAMDLAAGSERIAQTNKNIVDGIAKYQSQNSGWDGATASHVAATDAWYKKDANGKLVPKNLNEIDSNADYAGNVLKGEHSSDLWSDKESLKATNDMIGKEKIEDANQPTTYKQGVGSLEQLGYHGKVPAYLVDPVNVDGKMTAQLKSANYRLPGAEHDFVDNERQNVKVLPPHLFNQYYNGNDGFAAMVNKQVRSELEKVAGGKDGVQYGPQSDYADMLKQKYAYEALKGQVDGKFTITSEKDDSANEMRKVQDQKNQNQRLSLAEHNSARQDEKMNAILAKGKDPIETRDIYKETYDLAKSAVTGTKGKAFNLLSATAQDIILEKVKNLPEGNTKLDQSKVYLRVANNDNLELVGADDKFITKLTPEDLNAGKVNPSKPERQSALQKIKNVGKKVINAVTPNKSTAKFDNL